MTTIGDIKKQALMLMFVNYENDLSEQDVDTITDEEYTRYLVNMNSCINRAIKRIQNAGVLPKKTAIITASTQGEIGTFIARYNLPSIIEDIHTIERITMQDNGTGLYDPNVGFGLEGDVLLLLPLTKTQTYRVLYTPSIGKIALNAPSNTQINVPDEVAEIIPYFIKAELYEEDEPAMAAQARNIFEATLDSLRRSEYSVQRKVVNVYGGLY